MSSPAEQHADTRFEALAQSAPDAILTIDEGSVIRSANPATERIFGWRPEELVGQRLTVLIPERMRGQHDAGVERYLATGERHIAWTGVSLPGLTRDGREIPLEISFGEFTDEEGRHVFSGFVRDVSERVRYERELQAARATAEGALRELAMVERVTKVALARGTYDEMLRELLHSLREELATDSATVLLLDEERGELVVRASDGLYEQSGGTVHVPVGEGIAGKVAATARPVVINDIAAVDVVSRRLRERVTSLAAVPVISEGAVIGVLHVGSRAPRHFTEGDVRLLEIVAARMAGVFARTRLFEAERSARQEAEALRTLAQAITGSVRIGEVMHQIAVGALSVSGAAGAFVEQVVSPDGEVEVVASAGEGTIVRANEL